MEKFYIYLKYQLGIILFLIALSSNGQIYPCLLIDMEEIVLSAGETYQLPLNVGYQETMGSEIFAVSVKWSTEPGYLGKTDKNGIFTASHPGKGTLIAKFKDTRASIKVTVTGTQRTDGDKEDENDYPKVKIVPGNIRVETSDSVELKAFYINEAGLKVDTFFQWSVSNAELGEFPLDTTSMFYALHTGKGYITATLGNLSDSVKLSVLTPKTNPENKNSKKLSITPGDTIIHLQPGQTIQYHAILKNINADFSALNWTVSDESVATIDAATGLLTLGEQTGLTLIKANIGKITATAELLVVDPDADLTINTITLHRVLPDGNELPPKTFKEGESYKIGGLPYPLNILNAGMLHFPFGCIHEDVTIFMFIPEEYADLDEDGIDVEFEESIITGVKFHVVPAGSEEIVEPYYFDTPVILSMVFKRGLLDSLQMNPENLDVFFADNAGFVKVDDKVDIDTLKNKIYAKIEHFSTIVVKQKSNVTANTHPSNSTDESLSIFPNPFNTTTRIRYHLKTETDVNIAIYNMFGQKIKQLTEEIQPSGMHNSIWNGTNDSGAKVPNGIYICRMLKDGKLNQVNRIVLNRN